MFQAWLPCPQSSRCLFISRPAIFEVLRGLLMCIFGMLSSPLSLCDGYHVPPWLWFLWILHLLLWSHCIPLCRIGFVAYSCICPSTIHRLYCDVLCSFLRCLWCCFYSTLYSTKKDWILASSAEVCTRGQALYLTNCSFSFCHMLRPSTKLLSVSRLIRVSYPWCDSWLPYPFSASRITYH